MLFNTFQMQQNRISDNFCYDINKFLGKGSFGEVYLGKKIDSDEPIAVKIVEISKDSSQSSLKRQLKITSNLNALQSHHILKTYGMQIHQNTGFFYFQLCRGDLSDFKKIKDQLVILKICRQVLQGLVSLHEIGLMHRDIKLQNILMGLDGKIKISDFGLSKFQNLSNTKNKGTPFFMAPEVFESSAYTKNCDVWSFGIIMLELLQQKFVFRFIKRQDQLKVKLRQFQNQSFNYNLRKDLDPMWETFLRTILVYDPTTRPSSKQILQLFMKQYHSLEARIRKKMKVEPWNAFQSFQKLDKCRKYWRYLSFKKQYFFDLVSSQLSQMLNEKNSTEKILILCLKFMFLIFQHSRSFIQITALQKDFIYLPDQIINKRHFLQAHQQTLKGLVDKQKNKLRKQSSQIINNLQNIEAQLNREANNNPNHQKLEDCNRILLIMQTFKQTTNVPNCSQILTFYNKLLSDQLSNIQQKLNQMSDFDLRRMTVLNSLSRLDEIVKDKNYLQFAYPRKEADKLSKKSRDNMIVQLKVWNAKVR